jgi:hypothetical protein
MNILRKKVIKVVPVWLLAVVMVGTAAGALFWISNLVSNDVTVTDPPIEISGSFESTHYVGMEMVSSFTYILHDAAEATGYIIIDIIQTGMTLEQVGGITVQVLNDMGGDMTGAICEQAPISDGYRFVLCDSDGMIPFDFGEMGMATAGEIYVGITFDYKGSYGVNMQVSQTPP